MSAEIRGRVMAQSLYEELEAISHMEKVALPFTAIPALGKSFAGHALMGAAPGAVMGAGMGLTSDTNPLAKGLGGALIGGVLGGGAGMAFGRSAMRNAATKSLTKSMGNVNVARPDALAPVGGRINRVSNWVADKTQGWGPLSWKADNAANLPLSAAMDRGGAWADQARRQVADRMASRVDDLGSSAALGYVPLFPGGTPGAATAQHLARGVQRRAADWGDAPLIRGTLFNR